MKFAIRFFAALYCMSRASAQTSEISLITVHYDFLHMVDSTQKDAPYKDDVVLYIGKNTSLYTSYSNILADSRMNDFILKNPGVKLGPQTVYYGAPISCYKNLAAHKFSTIAIYQNNYLIEEDEPKIEWDIKNETKIINSYKCQKAITVFRGRSYEAWFTNELAFSNGPWKLGGLPGLILEASDAQKEVVFLFNSLENTIHTPIVLPENTIKTTTRELDRAIQAGQNGASQQQGQINMKEVGSNNIPIRKKQYNNPIEKTFY